MKALGDRLTPWLERALDLSAKRHDVLAGNLANIDTPNYQPKDLEFDEQLAAELNTNQEGGGPAIEAPLEAQPRLDGNQLDLDGEIARITANRVFYQLSTEVLTRRLARLRYAIDEGGR